MAELHWPAGVAIGVFAATGVPSRLSPNGQKQVAVLTPFWRLRSSVQAKLKQFANDAPTFSVVEQS